MAACKCSQETGFVLYSEYEKLERRVKSLDKRLRAAEEKRAQYADKLALRNRECAAMRAALELVSKFHLPEIEESAINEALSTDAGKGWVSPEEHGRLVERLQDIHAARIDKYERELEQAQAERDQARAEASAAVAAFVDFSEHTVMCDDYRPDSGKCSCGLDKTLAKLKDGTTAKELLERLRKLEGAKDKP